MPHKAAQPFPICASTSFRVPAHGHGAFNFLTVRPIGSQQEVSDSGLRRQVDESPQQKAATAWSERCHSTPASRRMRLSEPALAFGLAFRGRFLPKRSPDGAFCGYQSVGWLILSGEPMRRRCRRLVSQTFASRTIGSVAKGLVSLRRAVVRMTQPPLALAAEPPFASDAGREVATYPRDVHSTISPGRS